MRPRIDLLCAVLSESTKLVLISSDWRPPTALLRLLKEVLPRVMLVHGPDFRLNGPYSDNPDGLYLDLDDRPFPGRLLSLSLGCRWNDQGWGYCKGRFELQLVRDSEVVARANDEPLGSAPRRRTYCEGTLTSEHPVVAQVRWPKIIN